MPDKSKQMIAFLETFIQSRAVLFNKFPEGTYGPTVLGFNPGSEIIFLEEGVRFVHTDPNQTAVWWEANFKDDEIKIKSHSKYKMSYTTCCLFIKDGSTLEDPSYQLKGRPGGGNMINLPKSTSKKMLEKIVDLIKASTPLVEASMKEYKTELAKNVHGFFEQIKTDVSSSTQEQLRQSTSKEVDDLILSYVS